MTESDLETVYDALAQAIDTVGPEQAELYLAKLALALVEDLGDADRSLQVIAECTTGLDRV
ncbi:MAG: hypothetical protein AB3N23_22130 [Paracoccaceae bacterium]